MTRSKPPTDRPFRSALITGASQGIGAAFAHALPPTTDLLLTGRDGAALAQVRDHLIAESGSNNNGTNGRSVELLPADLSTENGRTAVLDWAQARNVDLVINNAGAGGFGPVLEASLEDTRATVELNITTVVVLTRSLLPGMIERAKTTGQRAGMILVSSQLAYQPLPLLATYGASKTFVLAWGEAFAEELKDLPVDLLVLCPSITRTGFGTRAGFRLGDLPGAVAPEKVAREGLEALGRRRVHICGLAQRLAFTPLVQARGLATRGLGTVMAMVDRKNQAAP